MWPPRGVTKRAAIGIMKRESFPTDSTKGNEMIEAKISREKKREKEGKKKLDLKIRPHAVSELRGNPVSHITTNQCSNET